MIFFESQLYEWKKEENIEIKTSSLDCAVCEGLGKHSCVLVSSRRVVVQLMSTYLTSHQCSLGASPSERLRNPFFYARGLLHVPVMHILRRSGPFEVYRRLGLRKQNMLKRMSGKERRRNGIHLKFSEKRQSITVANI